jgi:hypothetical protein
MTDIEQVLGRMRQTEPYFEDRGFTAAVLAALPEERELPLWVKNLILIGATATGSGIVAWQLKGASLENVFTGIAPGPWTIATAALLVYAFCSAAVWVVRSEVV